MVICTHTDRQTDTQTDIPGIYYLLVKTMYRGYVRMVPIPEHIDLIVPCTQLHKIALRLYTLLQFPV